MYDEPCRRRGQLTPVQQRDWSAAHILYENDIAACLAGSPVSAFYGSDDLWLRIPILVQDGAFDFACEVLNASGYDNVVLNPNEYKAFQPPEYNVDGTEAVKWRSFSSPNQNGFPVILAPASHWHLDIREDTTIVVQGIRIPTLVAYLEALTSLLAQRCRASIPAGYYKLQALNVWILRHKRHDEFKELSPADRFFLERFSSLMRLPNHRRVADLWEQLKRGVVTIDEALKAAPVERRPEQTRRTKIEESKFVQPTPAS